MNLPVLCELTSSMGDAGLKISETRLVFVVDGNTGTQLSQGEGVVGGDSGLGEKWGTDLYSSAGCKSGQRLVSLLEGNVCYSMQKVGPAQASKAVEEPVRDLSPRRS